MFFIQKKLIPGKIHRSQSESLYCGGKGINVSFVLREFGVESTAQGFLSGFTGEMVESELKEKGVFCDFVHLTRGFTRINVKIRADEETDVNGCGPEVNDEELACFLKSTDRFRKGDIVVLAGSVPKTLPGNLYETIMRRHLGKGIRFVVDAEGELLMRTLPYHPFLIKPNADELGEIFSVSVSDFPTAAFYADRLRQMGAENVLVSLGEQGAALVDEKGNIWEKEAYSGRVVNTVGAGDSMIAGFLSEYVRSGDFKRSLQMGTAAGCATAFSEGLARFCEIESFIGR